MQALLAVMGLAISSTTADQNSNMRALIEQALDQPLNLEIKDQPLSAAFEQIGSKTGVKLTIRPEVVNLLPYGNETRVSATIKNATLRQGLTEMLNHLGMTYAVREDGVAIEARPPLRRICRRATWSDLRQLYELTTTPWSAELGAKLPFQFQVKAAGDPRELLLAQSSKVGAGMAADVLEAACKDLGWTWYPWDNFIVVLSLNDQADRFIERPVSLRYINAALADVLVDLARQADLRLRLEPGVLRDLPIQIQQNVNLQMRDTTIRQGLEMLSGATGLGYEVTPEEIVIKATKESRALSSQPISVFRSENPVVGQITIPGKSGMFNFVFTIRESDLPPKLNQLRKDKIKQAVQTMERELAP